MDEELVEISETEEEAERLKAKWAAIEAAAGTKERLADIARDIVTHFEERTQGLFGKGMIICMSRRICVALYGQIIRLRPQWHDLATDKGQIKIVMTGDLMKDPKEWNEQGHITTKERREHIKARMKDTNDPLKLVIVRDMWLTGTDIPCLHSLYVDKPMRGHSLMQAVAKVNRVFRDKPGGLVVDFIGIGHLLKEAARKYTTSGFGSPSENLDGVAKAQFFEALEETMASLPKGSGRKKALEPKEASEHPRCQRKTETGLEKGTCKSVEWEENENNHEKDLRGSWARNQMGNVS